MNLEILDKLRIERRAALGNIRQDIVSLLDRTTDVELISEIARIRKIFLV